jgi:hypothetical protein
MLNTNTFKLFHMKSLQEICAKQRIDFMSRIFLFNENFQSLTVIKKATLGRLFTSTGLINLISKNTCGGYSVKNVKKDTLLELDS